MIPENLETPAALRFPPPIRGLNVPVVKFGLPGFRAEDRAIRHQPAQGFAEAIAVGVRKPGEQEFIRCVGAGAISARW